MQLKFEFNLKAALSWILIKMECVDRRKLKEACKLVPTFIQIFIKVNNIYSYHKYTEQTNQQFK